MYLANTNGLSWVFLKLYALWWIKIRSLWKLPDGRDWLWFMDLTFQVSLPYKVTLIHWPNIPGSYAILFFTALGFTSTTWHIHNWALFLLWLSLFILSGVISPLFSSSILDTYQPGEFIFQCHIFLPFHIVIGFSKQEYWSGLPFPSPVDHILSELSTMTCPPWVALYSPTHSFIELDNTVFQAISFLSFQ